MRKLVILTAPPSFFEGDKYIGKILLPVSRTTKNVTLPRNKKNLSHLDWRIVAFSNARSLLGTENPFAFLDIRSVKKDSIHFNLDAFAILAGTIQQGGTLYLICPDWHCLDERKDEDALRWNANQSIACPNFYAFFKECVNEFGFEITDQFEWATSGQITFPFCKFTPEQQNIFENLPLDPADIHLITAPRGRGKSTLAGKLATKIAQTSLVFVTARSQSTLPSFWQKHKDDNIQFISPDNLVSQLKQGTIPAQSWLFIDEAASLPLPMLEQFCQLFHKMVLTSTTHNYEGTGRGFSLKLPLVVKRKLKQWQLTEPQRWKQNDPLEQFIDRLLLLNEATEQHYPAQTKAKFYQLLAQAHYKTTPTDLRRLFDAEDQLFHSKIENAKLIGGIWAVKEGGLDQSLSQAIWRGERRPQGNLLAQYLCFHGNLPEASQLRSVRISRIAVEPKYQHQGIGKRLVSDFILQMTTQKQLLVDFISVSFGQTEALLHFWQACGFTLVQVTPNKEASSGYRSAMMLYPLTEKGHQFTSTAKARFERNVGLLAHLNQPKNEVADELDESDWENLHGFAYAQRSFQATYVSLKRLYWKYPEHFAFMHVIFEQGDALPPYKKQWLNQYRLLVQKILQENAFFAC